MQKIRRLIGCFLLFGFSVLLAPFGFFCCGPKESSPIKRSILKPCSRVVPVTVAVAGETFTSVHDSIFTTHYLLKYYYKAEDCNIVSFVDHYELPLCFCSNEVGHVCLLSSVRRCRYDRKIIDATQINAILAGKEIAPLRALVIDAGKKEAFLQQHSMLGHLISSSSALKIVSKLEAYTALNNVCEPIMLSLEAGVDKLKENKLRYLKAYLKKGANQESPRETAQRLLFCRSDSR